MTKKNVAKNTATKTETAVKPEAVKPEATTPNAPFPVFPTKLSAKTKEFCDEFNTIQLLKKHTMTKTGPRKLLLEAEIEARKKLLGVFQTQVEFLLNDAREQVNKELA